MTAAPSAQTRSSYQDYLQRWQMLDNEYVGGQWRARQEDVISLVQPYRGRFNLNEQNRQPRKDTRIVNGTAIDASRNLEAALLTGITSAARKWVSFSSSIPAIRDDRECKAYFEELRDVVLQLFAESNFYKVLAQVYADLVGPATSLMWLEEDERDVIRAVHRPVGQYRLACDARGRVSTVYERFSMTVEQVVERFCIRPGRREPDYSRLSQSVKDKIANRRFDDWVEILHVVEPRTLRQYGRIDKKNKPWASCWMEWAQGRAVTGSPSLSFASGPEDQLLEESGFDEQAFIAPRWDATGEDVYGCNSPAMLSIGDVKTLQDEEIGTGKLIAKLMDPPMNVPPALHSGSLVPGAKNYNEDPKQKFEPSYVPDHQAVAVVGNDKEKCEQRVRRAFYGELLFLISSDPRATPATAEEIRAKKEERLLGLGGVFGRFSDEGLTPALNRGAALAQRKGLVRPPPKKLIEAALRGGRIIKPEFLNSIAEAQKAQGVAPMQGWVNDAISIAKETGREDVLDKIDFDQFMDLTADYRGVPTKLLVDTDVANQKRQARQQAQQTAAATEQGVQQAKTYKDLSQSDPEQVQQVFRQFSPAAEAEATGPGL